MFNYFKPICSVKDPITEMYISRIKQKLDQQEKISFEEMAEETCSWNPKTRNFDLFRVHCVIDGLLEDIHKPIEGGYAFLQHILDCKGCLYALKVPLREE